jgi:hypothetical protein
MIHSYSTNYDELSIPLHCDAALELLDLYLPISTVDVCGMVPLPAITVAVATCWCTARLALCTASVGRCELAIMAGRDVSATNTT